MRKAVVRSRYHDVELLLKQGANVNGYGDAFGFCEKMTFLELAVDNLDCRMVALLFCFGASPRYNVFDGYYVHHPQRSAQGFFTERILQDGFDGMHAKPGFLGLHALLPRLPRWQGGDIEPMRALLALIEAATLPLPRHRTSYIMPPGTRTRCTISMTAWGASGTHYLDFSPRHFQTVIATQLSVCRYMHVRLSVDLPEISCRIAAMVMSATLWGMVADVSFGGKSGALNDELGYAPHLLAQSST